MSSTDEYQEPEEKIAAIGSFEITYDDTPINRAAIAGDIDLMRDLLDPDDAHSGEEALCLAALYGHYALTDWLLNETATVTYPDALDCAAANGDLEIVKLLHDYGISSNECLTAAIRGNSLDAFKFLNELGRFSDEDAGVIARLGRVEFAEYIFTDEEWADAFEDALRTARITPVVHDTIVDWMRKNYSGDTNWLDEYQLS
jgi:ankyrin repeat protein